MPLDLKHFVCMACGCDQFWCYVWFIIGYTVYLLFYGDVWVHHTAYYCALVASSLTNIKLGCMLLMIVYAYSFSLSWFFLLKDLNMPFWLYCSSRSERVWSQWSSLCFWTFECLQPINNQNSQWPSISLCVNYKRRVHIWWESKKCTGCWIQSCNRIRQ
jgi:hypothetical protein